MRLVHGWLKSKPFTAKDAKDAKEKRGGCYQWRELDIEVPDQLRVHVGGNRSR